MKLASKSPSLQLFKIFLIDRLLQQLPETSHERTHNTVPSSIVNATKTFVLCRF
jgi:hypothetical protein